MLAAARDEIERLMPAEVRTALEEGAIVIDLRCRDERGDTGVIPGSVTVGRSVLEWRCDPSSPWADPAVARPDARVILVCADGYSSSLAAASLRRLGFDRAGDLIGGMNGWLEAGLPVERVSS